VGDIEFWVISAAEISNKFQKTRFGRKNQLGCGNTWVNDTGHTSVIWHWRTGVVRISYSYWPNNRGSHLFTDQLELCWLSLCGNLSSHDACRATNCSTRGFTKCGASSCKSHKNQNLDPFHKFKPPFILRCAGWRELRYSTTYKAITLNSVHKCHWTSVTELPI
jgi:hypothetical protein